MSPRTLGPVDAEAVRRYFVLRHENRFMRALARETIKKARGLRDRGMSR